jgi:hypothetical protein
MGRWRTTSQRTSEERKMNVFAATAAAAEWPPVVAAEGVRGMRRESSRWRAVGWSDATDHSAPSHSHSACPLRSMSTHRQAQTDERQKTEQNCSVFRLMDSPYPPLHLSHTERVCVKNRETEDVCACVSRSGVNSIVHHCEMASANLT